MTGQLDEIHPTTLRILKALRGGAKLSRNRHFSLFRDPKARQGLRLFHYLRSVADDVREHQSRLNVAVVGDEEMSVGDIALKIDIPLLNGHRTRVHSPASHRRQPHAMYTLAGALITAKA